MYKLFILPSVKDAEVYHPVYTCQAVILYVSAGEEIPLNLRKHGQELAVWQQSYPSRGLNWIKDVFTFLASTIIYFATQMIKNMRFACLE